MYLQEVVISPDIFEKVHNASAKDSDEFLDMRSYLQNLKLKKIIFESEPLGESLISNEYFRFRDNSDDEQKRCIKAMLDTILVSERISVKKVDGNSAYCKDKIWNTLLCLSLLSESKIINAENKNHKELARTHKELSDIEILNFEEFIKPPNQSRLFCLEKEMEFKKNSTIRFEKLFRPYLADAKKLVISDRYFRKRNGGYPNFLKIVRLVHSLESIEIKTYDDKKLASLEKAKYKPSDYVLNNELESEMKKVHPNLKVSYSNSEHARYIETDQFRIDIDPGFDFVNQRYLADYNNVIFRFKKIN
jgi:hypothetical protein